MKEKYFELRRKGFRASLALQVAKYTKYSTVKAPLAS
jgi:hypothetical protein